MKLQVEKILDERQVKYRLIKLTRKAYTVDDVINYSEGEVNTDEICKTIILQGKKSGKKIAFFLKGRDKVSFSAIKNLIGEEMTVANATEVKEASGVAPGAVCPFLLNVNLFTDKNVLALDVINCGSGHHLYGLEFNASDLDKKLRCKVADFAKVSEES
jgi:prolyl-tRNA editing enzyme YbaK/EbsC (Cys-tRNA(Pro) deacylase)